MTRDMLESGDTPEAISFLSVAPTIASAVHVGHQQLDQVTLCLLNTILDNRLGLTDAATGTVTETVAILGLQKDQVAARK